MCQTNRTLEDYLAKRNFEGNRNVWKGNRIKLDYILSKIKKYLKPSLAACDVGIGDGYTLTWLNAAGLKVTGIDISRYSIEHLRNNFKKKGLHIELIHGDISDIQLEDGQFDIVTCFDILEHIPQGNLKLVIKTLKRCIVNGGLLIGTLPLAEDLSENMVMCPKCNHIFHEVGHFHSFATTQEIRKLLKPEFTIIKMGIVSLSLFQTNLTDYLCFHLSRLMRRIARRKVATTIYFVAQVTKS